MDLGWLSSMTSSERLELSSMEISKICLQSLTRLQDLRIERCEVGLLEGPARSASSSLPMLFILP